MNKGKGIKKFTISNKKTSSDNDECNSEIKNIKHQYIDDSGLKPKYNPEAFNDEDNSNENDVNEGKIELFGKVAKFSKKVKPSNAYSFLESVKISKDALWYFIIEHQDDNQLQMIKYNNKEGVIITKFINELKSYYLNKYKENSKICESLSKIEIIGNKDFSTIKNIDNIIIDGKKLITKITEDLIRILSN